MSIKCKLVDCPPEPEIDHYLGTCCCHTCTCGLHKCHQDFKTGQKYFPSTLATNYKKEYYKKLGIHSPPYIRDSALNSGCAKMDMHTINQQDYVAHKAEKTKSAKYIRETHEGVLKFAGVSNYKSEYPNWGHYEFINIGNPQRPYGDSNVKLNGMTTYTQNFGNRYKMTKTQSQKRIQTSNPLTAGGDFYGSTTSRNCYKEFKGNNFPERVQNKAFGIIPLESPKGCYETMYAYDYTKKEAYRRCTCKKRGELAILVKDSKEIEHHYHKEKVVRKQFDAKEAEKKPE